MSLRYARRLAAVLVFAAMLVAGWIGLGSVAVAAPALSITTLAFLSDTRPTNDFLAASSRLAETQAERPAIRAFARREVASRDDALAAFTAWATGEQRRADAAEARRDPVARILGPEDDRLVIDVTPPQPNLSALAALHGPDFDDPYIAAQTRALERLVAAYADFILNGDDQTLRALAVHDLPHAKHLLAEVRQLR